MNNKKFIKKLKKSLSLLSNKERDNIVKEIQSHHQQNDETSLYQQFGDPEILARQYLSPEEWLESKRKKKRKKRNKIILLLIISILFLLYWGVKSLIKDEFNYADNIIRQKEFSQMKWQSLDSASIDQLNIRQSKVVITPSKGDQLQMSCKGKLSLKKAEEPNTTIYQNFCYIQLPIKVMSLNIDQSSVILIEPFSMDISLNQSELRVSHNENNYAYEFVELHRSSVDEKIALLGNKAQNNEKVLKHIKIKAKESNIKQYQ